MDAFICPLCGSRNGKKTELTDGGFESSVISYGSQTRTES